MQPLTVFSPHRETDALKPGSAILGKAKMIIAAVWQARIVCA